MPIKDAISGDYLQRREFMRPNQLAAYLGVSDRTLREWLSAGYLPHIKIGRVVMIEVEKAVAAFKKFERVESSPKQRVKKRLAKTTARLE
jgi:excisionase family DNA binding protein